jgi:hypothetical protein
MKAKIIWLPELLTYITEDNLENTIPWNEHHLNAVRTSMKTDNLLFPGVMKEKEIHCGHYRFKIAKEMGYDGIQMYRATTFKEVLKLTKFTELCYEHYKEYKKGDYI